MKTIKLRSNSRLPEYKSNAAAGADLFASLETQTVIPPGGRALIPCGIAMEMSVNVEGQIRPRSGLALKHGVTVLNSPGTIDSDYRGEIAVVLINHGEKPFIVSDGDRVAQIVMAHVPPVFFSEVDALSTTERGDGGFGSTGTGDEHAR